MSRRSGRSQLGFTIAELMAAITLVGIGLTVSMHVISGGRALDDLTESAELRSQAAERLMERTIALGFDGIAARWIALERQDAGGRSGWTASIEVRPLPGGLKEVRVAVRGEGRSSELWTLVGR